MKKPIKGMQQRPIGHELLGGAWLGTVIYAFSVEENRDLFEIETGINISDVINAAGLPRAIDHATGFEKEALVKWADWVTKNLWGVKG